MIFLDSLNLLNVSRVLYIVFDCKSFRISNIVNKNNPFYALSNCDLSIGVIPITSLSKLLVGVKPGEILGKIG